MGSWSMEYACTYLTFAYTFSIYKITAYSKASESNAIDQHSDLRVTVISGFTEAYEEIEPNMCLGQ